MSNPKSSQLLRREPFRGVPTYCFYLYTRAHPFIIILYIRVHVRNQKCAKKHKIDPKAQNDQKKVIFLGADNQAVTKKMHFLCNFFAKIFGHIKNLLYLCTRF